MARTDIIYDDTNFKDLLFDTRSDDGSPECLPRETEYNSRMSRAIGLVPVEEDLIVPEWADIKELIAWAHENKIFPVYHQKATWAPDGFKWNQNGLPWCWTWGMTSCVMDVEARDNRFTNRLAPTSLGGAVNWQQKGYFLDGTIAHAARYGICEESFAKDEHGSSRSNFREGWEENAKLHRPLEWWETRCRGVSDKFIAQQAMAIFKSGTPCYIAHNWWGHALNLCALEWDESKPNNLVWVHRNSHNEPAPIRLSGSKGSPDEIYGIRALA